MRDHVVLPEDELSQAMYSQKVANPFVKVIVVGDGGAGKSETVQSLKNGTFVGQHIITDLLDVAALQTDDNDAWSVLDDLGALIGGALYEVHSRLCKADLSTIERDVPKSAASKMYSQHSAMMVEHLRHKDTSRPPTSNAPAPRPSPTVIGSPPTNSDDDNDNDNDKADNGNTSVANDHNTANNIDDVNTSTTTNNNDNDRMSHPNNIEDVGFRWSTQVLRGARPLPNRCRLPIGRQSIARRLPRGVGALARRRFGSCGELSCVVGRHTCQSSTRSIEHRRVE
jgi:GTPase SAR1 family protein